MSELVRLQDEFQAFVLDGVAGIASGVVETSRVPASTRLAIYSDAYRARLAEALENNFPVLAKLLGGEQFAGLAGRYIAQHRSAHYSIRWYGARLPELLARESPYREQALLAELADWEWKMTLAFDAADAAALSASKFEALAPEQWGEVLLVPHPSVHVLSLRTNAPAAWRALNRDETPPAFTAGDAQAWLIWRRGLDTWFRSMDASEARALAFIAAGPHRRSFGDLCELLAQGRDEAEAATEGAKLLRRWLDDELLASESGEVK
jgi:hypothetical protein